jgi:hypothetical protein
VRERERERERIISLIDVKLENAERTDGGNPCPIS